MKENRQLEAVVVGDPGRRVLRSVEISPSSTRWVGSYPVKPGKRLHLRIKIDEGRGRALYLDAYITVTEVFKDRQGQTTGFEGQWIRASSVGEIEPLKTFLKDYLKVEGGFVQILKPESEHEVPVYSYSFVRGAGEFSLEEGAMEKEIGPASSKPEISEDSKEEVVEETKKEEPSQEDSTPQKKWPTRVYATIPIVYIWEGQRVEATAVKLKPEGLRIDTQEHLPQLYSPLQVELPVSVSGKPGRLTLNATVSVVKPAKSHKGGQFEVKFSLKNLPAMLQGYRSLLRELQESLGT